MTTVRPRVKPVRRVNPSGATVWIARYPTRDGARRSAGTYTRRGPCPTPAPGCRAQHAIDTAIDREWGTGPRRPDTIGAYAQTWTARHPRSARTNATNEHRLARILDARVEGVPLRDWPFADLRRRHTVELRRTSLRSFTASRRRCTMTSLPNPTMLGECSACEGRHTWGSGRPTGVDCRCGRHFHFGDDLWICTDKCIVCPSCERALSPLDFDEHGRERYA